MRMKKDASSITRAGVLECFSKCDFWNLWKISVRYQRIIVSHAGILRFCKNSVTKTETGLVSQPDAPGRPRKRLQSTPGQVCYYSYAAGIHPTPSEHRERAF